MSSHIADGEGCVEQIAAAHLVLAAHVFGTNWEWAAQDSMFPRPGQSDHTLTWTLQAVLQGLPLCCQTLTCSVAPE